MAFYFKFFLVGISYLTQTLKSQAEKLHLILKLTKIRWSLCIIKAI